MRVGIDARTLERTEEVRGIGVLVSSLVQYLPAEDVDLVLFFSRPPDRTLRPGAKEVVLRLGRGTPRRVLGIIWEQLLLPAALRREPLDLYHAPANRGTPLVGRGRFVASVNDVIPLVTPYFFDSRPDPRLTTPLFRFLYASLVGIGVRRADRIITLSECSRRDLERLFPRARGKVRVIYPGYDPRYRRVEDREEIRRALAAYALPERFLVYVGGLGQRKNVGGLLRAYALLAQRRPETPPLVVVGTHNAFVDPLRTLARILGISGRVYFPGFVAIEDMPALLSAAELLAYPSFYEGFGLPVVEAMACGCPVVCSGTSSLPEVGQDAVVYCDPARPADIADKVEQVLADREIRHRLIVRGLRRAQEFSMHRMVRETLRVYQEVVSPTRVAGRAAPAWSATAGPRHHR